MRPKLIAVVTILVAALFLLGLPEVCEAASAKYRLPQGALHARHVLLADTGGEEDYFDLLEDYPSTRALDHYQKVFSRWTECKPEKAGWQSFSDVSGPKPVFVHQLSREWIRPDNKSVVTLGLQYYSSGTGYRIRPDNNTQHVVLIEYNVQDGRLASAQLGYKCAGG